MIDIDKMVESLRFAESHGDLRIDEISIHEDEHIGTVDFAVSTEDGRYFTPQTLYITSLFSFVDVPLCEVLPGEELKYLQWCNEKHRFPIPGCYFYIDDNNILNGKMLVKEQDNYYGMVASFISFFRHDLAEATSTLP